MIKQTCIRQFADHQQIKKCKERIKTANKSFAQLSNILALTGNEVRLTILYLLEEEKELCPCDLADILGMSIPAISQHLRKLKDGKDIAILSFGHPGNFAASAIRDVKAEGINPAHYDMRFVKPLDGELIQA